MKKNFEKSAFFQINSLSLIRQKKYIMTSNNLKNLETIKNAMDLILEIDKSNYHKNYYSEVLMRIEEEKSHLKMINGK